VSDRIPPFAAYVTLLAGMPAAAAAAAGPPRTAHCKWGHERTAQNLRTKQDGTHDCRLCQQIFAKRSRQKASALKQGQTK